VSSNLGTLDEDRLVRLLHELAAIRGELIEAELRSKEVWEKVHPSQHRSARNLIHYLALRRTDLRPLQPRLSSLGLSSLGRSEAHVLATLDAVLRVLHALVEQPWPTDWTEGPVSIEEGREELKARTLALLGPKTPSRWVRIMATMPSEAATSPQLIPQLLESGMNCMRVNCAHDSADIWQAMVRHLQSAQQKTGMPCKILFDLGGPKLRTGPLALSQNVIKLRPTRDPCGRVLEAARIWLTPEAKPEPPPLGVTSVVPLPEAWLRSLRPGDRIQFEDARGSARELIVRSKKGISRWAECEKTAYVVAGTKFQLKRDAKGHGSQVPQIACLAALPEREEPILLQVGDRLVLTREQTPGRPAIISRRGRVEQPARISCTAPEVFQYLKAGQRVWLDDGKIGGVIRSVSDQLIHIEIVQASPKGRKLRADKGINFPDSTLKLPSLSRDDLRHLPTVARHADMVGYSFVQTPQDVQELQRHLARIGGTGLGIVLKIETRAAFENLPDLLLAAMRSPLVGVMIARGDLAVECGYERMAELQEEILWVCEAAHVPVIWATQVLENLSHAGLPTRAEVTDAAMGVRAECVMLNKGPEMVAAVRSLDNILRRMQAHQNKKQSMLRSLGIARNFATNQSRAISHGTSPTSPRASSAPSRRATKPGPGNPRSRSQA
jgi:pyruvate kinase